MKLCYKTNEYATHQPILIEIVKSLPENSCILELGSGEGSTGLLDELCYQYNHYVLTVDHNQEWLDKYSQKYNKAKRDYKRLDFDQIANDAHICGIEWELVFIDQGNWQSREDCTNFFKDAVQYVVLHDCDPFAYGSWNEELQKWIPNPNQLGKIITPIVPHTTPGNHDWSKTFKYSKEFYPPLPWPAQSGPPTLVGSNFHSLDNLNIDWMMEEI